MIRLLLVEDKKENRDALSRQLYRRGYDVLFAEDGQAGIDLASREFPDLVLLAMGVAGVAAVEVTRQLKDNAETSPIPIIALTEDGNEGEAKEAIEAGCDECEPVPVDFNSLMAKIGERLKKKAPE